MKEDAWRVDEITGRGRLGTVGLGRFRYKHLHREVQHYICACTLFHRVVSVPNVFRAVAPNDTQQCSRDKNAATLTLRLRCLCCVRACCLLLSVSLPRSCMCRFGVHRVHRECRYFEISCLCASSVRRTSTPCYTCQGQRTPKCNSADTLYSL